MPMIPDIPHPNSSTAELLSRTLCLNSRFDGVLVIHDANKGVIFQTTEYVSQTSKGRRDGSNLPAPVVPPALFDERTVGDWWIVKSRSPIESSKIVAFESTKPRFCEGIDCEKRRNASKKKLSYETSRK